MNLSVDKPTIKILLYTDDPQIAPTDNFGEFLGLGSMLARLKAHTPTFAELTTKWVSRSSDNAHHADNKLNVVLAREIKETGESFDEIWFFGLHQANTERFSLGAFRGGPDSELDTHEVAALTRWMKGNAEDGSEGGGVLMTGDHANEIPPKLAPTTSPCGDTASGATFLGLGRAIGRCVPRAGLLRGWEGPPTYHSVDSFSTIINSGLQTDRFPQQLLLRYVNPDGDPDPGGRPHPLFFYKPDQYITAFPDHGHEGAVIVPSRLDPAAWPSGPKGQTRPHVVAYSRDHRNDNILNILATYNGDLTGVGRIVADSTWHHYMNLNLKGFPHPAPEGSASDQIGQFYANLAIWLAPRRKRVQMAQAMCWQLARYTLLLEERTDAHSIGNTACAILTRAASPCETHELLQVLTPMQVIAPSELNDVNNPTQELFLGSILESFHQEMIRAETAEIGSPALADETGSDSVDRVIHDAFKRASELQISSLTERVARVRGASNLTAPAQTRERQERSAPMICTQPNQQWTIEMLTDPRPGKPEERATLVFCLNFNGSIIVGEVTDSEGTHLSFVTGHNEPLTELGLPDPASLATLNFTWGTNIVMTGVIYRVTTTRKFRGRFRAFVSQSSSAQNSMVTTLLSPGDGDTGTGTGTQT